MAAPTLNLDAMHLIWKFDGSGTYTSINIGGGTTGESFTTIANPGGADRIRGENSILYECTTATLATGEYHRQQLGEFQDLSQYDHLAIIVEIDDDTAYLTNSTRPANAAYDRGFQVAVGDAGGTSTMETGLLQFYGREPIFAIILPFDGVSTGTPDWSAIDEIWIGMIQRESTGGPLRAIYHSAWAFDSTSLFTPNKSPVCLVLDDQDIEQGPAATGGWLFDELQSRGLVGGTTLAINPANIGLANNMTWDDIQTYHDAGACIVDHTNNHEDPEVVGNAAWLESVDLGHSIIANRGLFAGNVCKAICYPFGRFNKELYDGLIERGYKIGRTTQRPLPSSPIQNSQYFNQTIFPELGPRAHMMLRTLRMDSDDSEHPTGADHVAALTQNRLKKQCSMHYGHEFVTTITGTRQFLRSGMIEFLDEWAAQVAAGEVYPSTLARGSDSYAAQMGFSDIERRGAAGSAASVGVRPSFTDKQKAQVLRAAKTAVRKMYS